MAIAVREGRAADWPALAALYPAAFPDEDLVPLVRALLELGRGVLSLVAERADAVVGHVVFTACAIEGRGERVDLLGPLAVAPRAQRTGIGGALVRAGLARVAAAGSAQVQVLGDPAYYGRFGFERDAVVAPPYALPEAWRGAWQAVRLGGAAPAGRLVVPEPWMRAALWGP